MTRWHGILGFLGASVVAAYGFGDVDWGERPLPDIKVEVTVSKAQQTTVQFTVTNNGAVDIKRGNLGENTNKIVILRPDGRVCSVYMSVDPGPPAVDPGPPVLLRPKESAEWRVELTPETWRLWTGAPQQGRYLLYWTFGGVRSEVLSLDWPFDGHAADRHDAPATRPAEKPNAATPKSAVRSLLLGLDGDLGMLHGAFDAEELKGAPDSPEAQLQLTLMRRASAASSFRNNVRGNFSKEQALEWREAAIETELSLIDGATVHYDKYFESAELRGEGMRPISLVRLHRGWAIRLSSLAKEPGVTPAFLRRTASLEKLADQIRRGSVATFDDAMAVLSKDGTDSGRSILRRRKGDAP